MWNKESNDEINELVWENWYFLLLSSLCSCLSEVHFYTTVVNTNRTLRPPNGQCTCVFVDKLKDMEPAKTREEAKEAC